LLLGVIVCWFDSLYQQHALGPPSPRPEATSEDRAADAFLSDHVIIVPATLPSTIRTIASQ
jgi:hypothetical protein